MMRERERHLGDSGMRRGREVEVEAQAAAVAVRFTAGSQPDSA
jgi:hypothetical protein